MTTNVSLEVIVFAAAGGCFLSTSYMFATVGGSRMYRFHRILLSIFTDASQAREKTKLDQQQQQKEMEEIMETAFLWEACSRTMRTSINIIQWLTLPICKQPLKLRMVCNDAGPPATNCTFLAL